MSSLLPSKPAELSQLTALLKTCGFKRGDAQFSKAQSFALPKMRLPCFKPPVLSKALPVNSLYFCRFGEDERKRRGSWKSVKINRLDQPTGPFPQLRNSSHYVGTAVWPWGWLLVVFSSCEANSHRPIIWKQKAWQKKDHYRTFLEAIRIQPDHPWINTSPYIIATTGSGSIQVEAEWTTTVAPTA